MNLNIKRKASKFEEHSVAVHDFLIGQLKPDQPDSEKIIYQHQVEAVFKVKKYFSVNPDKPDKPALLGMT